MRTWKPSSQRWLSSIGMDVEMVKKYLSKEQVHDQILTPEGRGRGGGQRYRREACQEDR